MKRTLKRNKGVEGVLAWVLLLGFSVTIGVMVFMWATKMSGRISENTVNYVEGDMSCEQVQIYSEFTRDNNGICKNIKTMNKGYLNITQIMIRGMEKQTGKVIKPQTIDFKPAMKPKEDVTSLLTDAINPNSEVDVIPVTSSNNRMILCTVRKVSLEC